MIKVVVCGALGRMGTTVGRLVHEAPDIELVAGIDVSEGFFFDVPVHPAREIDAVLENTAADVLVDFTVASAAVSNIQAAARHGVALVVGTTGFSSEQREAIRTAVVGNVPAVVSSNFSVGVNVFLHLVREAARRLDGYDVEVIEAHHRHKKDAPSGTAKMILDALESELGDRRRIYGREGMMERGNEIGVHVIRGGDIVGDHAVLFAGNFECIELSHRAYDRAVFASGALRAVRWVVGREAALYGMADVLNLT